MYFSSDIMTIINSYLGNEYWKNRKRLTWLNIHIDLINSDWFLSWYTLCRWASWRERHPEVTYNNSKIHELNWRSLPKRFLPYISLDLKDLKEYLNDINNESNEIRMVKLNNYIYPRFQWIDEAKCLRNLVHFI